MAFRVRVHCSDTVHMLAFKDDGSVVVNPELHDIDLERGLAEMGAKLPGCIAHFDAYDANLFQAIQNHAIEFVPGYYSRGTGYHSINQDLTGLVLADYLDHVAYVIGNKTNTRRIYDRVIALSRELFRNNIHMGITTNVPRHVYVDQSLHSAISAMGRSVARSLGQLKRSGSNYPRMAAVHAMAGMDWYVHLVRSRFSEGQRIMDIGRACRLAAAAYAVRYSGGGAQYSDALKRENAWQRRQLVAVMTAFVDGGPWPSVSPGGK